VKATKHVSSRLCVSLFSKYNVLQMQVSSQYLCLSLVSQQDSLPQCREALFYV
jgi:hypothetical protein